jgi:hypothetical protein
MIETQDRHLVAGLQSCRQTIRADAMLHPHLRSRFQSKESIWHVPGLITPSLHAQRLRVTLGQMLTDASVSHLAVALGNFREAFPLAIPCLA